MPEDADAAAAVALKLPSPWTNDLDSWFAQIEAQFALKNISSERTKYNHVVAVLEPAIASRLSTTLRSLSQTSAAAPYTTLKNALLAKYTLSSYERASAINAITGLGELKPSEMMDHMLCLLGSNTPGLMFRYHFLNILPDYVRNTLAYSTQDDLALLAAEADRIFICGRPRAPTDMPINSAALEDPAVNRVAHTRSRKQATSANKPCFYHARFGAKAIKCEGNCSWKPGNGSQGQQQ